MHTKHLRLSECKQVTWEKVESMLRKLKKQVCLQVSQVNHEDIVQITRTSTGYTIRFFNVAAPKVECYTETCDDAHDAMHVLMMGFDCIV